MTRSTFGRLASKASASEFHVSLSLSSHTHTRSLSLSLPRLRVLLTVLLRALRRPPFGVRSFISLSLSLSLSLDHLSSLPPLRYGAGTVGGKRQQVLYTSEILRIDGTAAPIFRVTASNAQDEPCEGATASAAWDAMFKRVSAAKAAEGAPHAIHSKANGSMMFGLSERHEAIVGVVEGLEDALECASYVFRSMRTPIIALGARASVPPARSRRRTARRSYEAAGAALFANRFVCPYHACQECGTALDGTSETGLARGDGKPIPFVRCFHCPTSYCMTCEPDATVEIMTDGGVIRCPASKEQHVADREAAAAARSARRAALDEVRRSVKPRYEAQIEAAEVEAKRAAAADKATAAAAAAGDARTAADAAPQKVVTPSDESSAMEVETTAATSAAAPAVALTLSPRVSAGKRAAASGAGFGGVLVSRRAKKKAQPKLHEREQDHGRFIRSLKAALSETEWKQWERVMKVSLLINHNRVVDCCFRAHVVSLSLPFPFPLPSPCPLPPPMRLLHRWRARWTVTKRWCLS